MRRQTLDHGDTFALAALGFTGDSHDAIRHLTGFFPIASTPGDKLRAPRTGPAAVGGVDQPAIFLADSHPQMVWALNDFSSHAGRSGFVARVYKPDPGTNRRLVEQARVEIQFTE